jgi:hypothetical protein
MIPTMTKNDKNDDKYDEKGSLSTQIDMIILVRMSLLSTTFSCRVNAISLTLSPCRLLPVYRGKASSQTKHVCE